MGSGCSYSYIQVYNKLYVPIPENYNFHLFFCLTYEQFNFVENKI